MTNENNTGGSAFPAAWGNPEQGGDYVSGMTLRDYAVIHYTAAMLAHQRRYKPRVEDASLHWHDAITKEAGEIADAMMRAREGEQR